jgi:hypothetical protein
MRLHNSKMEKTDLGVLPFGGFWASTGDRCEILACFSFVEGASEGFS